MALPGEVFGLYASRFESGWADGQTVGTITAQGGVVMAGVGTAIKYKANAAPTGAAGIIINQNVNPLDAGATATGFLRAANDTDLQDVLAGSYSLVIAYIVPNGKGRIKTLISKNSAGANRAFIAHGSNDNTADGKLRLFDGGLPHASTNTADGVLHFGIITVTDAEVTFSRDGLVEESFTPSTLTAPQSDRKFQIGAAWTNGYGGEFTLLDLRLIDHAMTRAERATAFDTLYGLYSKTTKRFARVGDSQSAGSGSSGGNAILPLQMKANLTSYLGINITMLNLAVGGKSTADFAPTGGNYPVSAIAADASQIVEIMLGPNDIRLDQPLTTAESLANLKALIAGIKAGCPTVELIVVHCSPTPGPWYAFGGPYWGTTSYQALEALHKAIRTLDDNGMVRLGDDQWYYATNGRLQSTSTDGVHFGDLGYAYGGVYQAQAMARILSEVGGGQITVVSASPTSMVATSTTAAKSYWGGTISYTWQYLLDGVWYAATGADAASATVTVAAGATALRRVAVDSTGRQGFAVGYPSNPPSFTSSDRALLEAVNTRVLLSLPPAAPGNSSALATVADIPTVQEIAETVSAAGAAVVVLSGNNTLTSESSVDGQDDLFVGARHSLVLRALVGSTPPGGSGATWRASTTNEATGAAISTDIEPAILEESLGYLSYPLQAADTASARRLRLTLKRTLGSDVRIFGPLVLNVRDR